MLAELARKAEEALKASQEKWGKKLADTKAAAEAALKKLDEDHAAKAKAHADAVAQHWEALLKTLDRGLAGRDAGRRRDPRRERPPLPRVEGRLEGLEPAPAGPPGRPVRRVRGPARQAPARHARGRPAQARRPDRLRHCRPCSTSRARARS